MYESYIKEVPIIDLKKEDYDYTIIQSILESQRRLELAHRNFEYARGDLVDYYAYFCYNNWCIFWAYFSSSNFNVFFHTYPPSFYTFIIS